MEVVASETINTKKGSLPMNIVAEVADALQGVLIKTANILARETGFVQRQRKLTGSGFVQTLVLGWLNKPDATLDDLCQTAATLDIHISPQGLDQRFRAKAADFLKGILEAAVSTVIAHEPVAIPVLERFNGVHILDSSNLTLPDVLGVIWPGRNSSKNTRSAVKTQIRLDLNTGRLTGPYLQSGREHDKSSNLQKDILPPGSLRIADLGYFSLSVMKDIDAEGAYWLTRVQSQCMVYQGDGRKWDLLDFLRAYCQDRIDTPILLGGEQIPCRLLAVKVPEEVANRRRQRLRENYRKRGKSPSKKQLALADWTIFATNAPQELMTLEEALVLMRCRWQIELIFKLWKSQGLIDEWRSKNPWRILCEVYAKLTAMVVQHWMLLVGCWLYPDRSLSKAAKTIQRHAMTLVAAFSTGSRRRIVEVLEIIQRCLSSGCRINTRRTKPNTYQLLLALEDTS